jgi:hypothetical protein
MYSYFLEIASYLSLCHSPELVASAVSVFDGLVLSRLGLAFVLAADRLRPPLPNPSSFANVDRKCEAVN